MRHAKAMNNSHRAAEAAEQRPSLISPLKRRIDLARDAKRAKENCKTKSSYRMAMQTAISVILCTHNPRPEYLGRVLASLRGQTLPVKEWELLLIDNASKQPLEQTVDISWHSRGRHIREDELGLTAARLRGIQESSGELLVFVDDDNLLAPEFLVQAAVISARYPDLGAFGAGILEPEFEVQPPVKLRPRLGLLAVRRELSALWSYNATDTRCRPWGAGLCATRRVANIYRQLVPNLGITAVLDRRGKRLFSGGDDVFSRIAAEAGLRFGVFPELCITHLISAVRLNQRYFVRLMHDHALSHGVLDYMFDGIRPVRTNLLRYGRLIVHGAKNGPFSMKCAWAASQGADGASQFISANQLKPLGLGGISKGGTTERLCA
jgi:glycosyltransferase involved in cell wall biosynthesis